MNDREKFKLEIILDEEDPLQKLYKGINKKLWSLFSKIIDIEAYDFGGIDHIIKEVESDIRWYIDEHKDIISNLLDVINNDPEMDGADNIDITSLSDKYRIMSEVASILKEQACDNNNYKEYKIWEKCQRFLQLKIYHMEIDLIGEYNNDDMYLYLQIFRLGRLLGFKEAIATSELDETFNYDLYKNYFHKKKSIDSIEKRWTGINELYEEAIVFAENSWEEGDELMHHEMAREIHKIEAYKELSLKTLREKLKPIAKKYCRFFNPNEKNNHNK